MTHYITHANRKKSNHTSWSEIEIYARSLESRGVKGVSTRSFDELEGVTQNDTLTVFCTGEPEEGAVRASLSAGDVFLVIQDAGWETHIEKFTTARHLITPFKRGLVRGASIKASLITLECLQLGLPAYEEVFFPFGAAGALDETNVSLLESHRNNYVNHLLGLTYVGSLKKSRIADMASLPRFSAQVSYFGRFTRDDLYVNRPEDRGVTFHGWVPPEHSVGVYSRASRVAVITDAMALMRLDYNRPYEISQAQARSFVMGEHAEAYKTQFYVQRDDFSDREALLSNARKMLEETRVWSLYGA